VFQGTSGEKRSAHSRNGDPRDYFRAATGASTSAPVGVGGVVGLSPGSFRHASVHHIRAEAVAMAAHLEDRLIATGSGCRSDGDGSQRVRDGGTGGNGTGHVAGLAIAVEPSTERLTAEKAAERAAGRAFWAWTRAKCGCGAGEDPSRLAAMGRECAPAFCGQQPSPPGLVQQPRRLAVAEGAVKVIDAVDSAQKNKKSKKKSRRAQFPPPRMVPPSNVTSFFSHPSARLSAATVAGRRRLKAKIKTAAGCCRCTEKQFLELFAPRCEWIGV